ncbi:MAG: sugar phosphate isomerase/epimerase family protein [Gemmatales bacterium]|nr:sugar phosphate isomerase/epimerase [Gemmatales bacterium]MDW7994458.1 sugar phosphate isomerase/epimerase family protein [Gemmatales bacterium]
MPYAICNETFAGWEHGCVCQYVASIGYHGLEVAPFTLAENVTHITSERRQQVRRQAEQAGIRIIGLHWLLARTQGLHLTSPDAEVRHRTQNYLIELARLCHDLGGWLLVFGSPGQRSLPPGVRREQGLDYAEEVFRGLLPYLEEWHIDLCIEPLTANETNFLTSCAEGLELVQRLNHPRVGLHLDVKAMCADPEASVPELIRRYGPWLRHFHANDPNFRGPGFGEVDFVPIFAALRDINYSGWVSVEVFDYSPDPETIATRSLQYMQACAEKAGWPG